MRKDIINSRLLHYALVVVSLSAATAGGLILLGCGPEQVKDFTVTNPDQSYRSGGVYFDLGVTAEYADVTLAAQLEGQPVTWVRHVADNNISTIPNAARSNEVRITALTAPGYRSVRFDGTYTVNGKMKQIFTNVPVHAQ